MCYDNDQQRLLRVLCLFSSHAPVLVLGQRGGHLDAPWMLLSPHVLLDFGSEAPWSLQTPLAVTIPALAQI